MTTTPDITTLDVRNPLGYPPKVAAKPMAPRLDGLDGKRIFIVDPRFDDGTNLLLRLIAWFGEHLPDVEIEHVELPGNYLGDFSATWADLRSVATRPSSASVTAAPARRRWPSSR